ncbi:hypothetical protein [Streptomyces sp. NPDC051211]|uniref:hypothetical protein n=1 Tax=Streptomyces sp. NPDC051211 TaxID=3154643 RepID=UPI00345016EE
MDSHSKAHPAPPVAAVPLPRATEASHPTDTVERGSFAVAVCGCGWRGPARRSRDKARLDAAAHSTH